MPEVSTENPPSSRGLSRYAAQTATPSTRSRHSIGFRFAEFELQLPTRELRIVGAGPPVTLEPRGFDVLCHLIEHRDRVVTKDELWRRFWAGQAICSGAIPQCISTLRRALRDSAREQLYLRTYHRVGYRFVAPAESY